MNCQKSLKESMKDRKTHIYLPLQINERRQQRLTEIMDTRLRA